MEHAIYIGPIKKLQGKTALLFKTKQPKWKLRVGHLIKAQFDDVRLTRNGKLLGYGGHVFKRSEFKLVASLD